MSLFTERIHNWQDWGKVFQSIPAFLPLLNHILQKEKLPAAKIKNLTPGTNAVFKAGRYVIKIFAPPELGMEVGTNFDTELFGIKRANALSIPAPKLIASGEIEDKYRFRYMIMEFLKGIPFGAIESRLAYDEKVIVGRNLRKITDKLNTPCKNFDPVDVLQNAMNNEGWADYPDYFNTERLAYLADMCINENEKVYCHGDMNPDNIYVDEKLELSIIDFADAMYVPAGYEQALIASELFCFERPYMTGYFGAYTVSDIVELCAVWLPVHDSGEHTLRRNIGPVSEITSLSTMRERLYNLIKTEQEKRVYIY